jgi:hypothetical protein
MANASDVAAVKRRSVRLLKIPSRAASVVTAVVVGIVVLIGWWLDIPALKSIFPGLVSMKANTAFAFLLVGMSLFFLRTKETGRARSQSAKRAACISPAPCRGGDL